MPEYPDVCVYIDCLAPRVVGRPLERARVLSPSLLRTALPPLSEAEGRRVSELRRMGKRIVFGLEDDLFLVLHLMVAGRLRWRKRGSKPPRRLGLASFEFPTGMLLLTEASTKKRASLHVLRGEEDLAALDPGGLEVFDVGADAFRERLRLENRTLKRALTDPRLVSGIGNAYSDEILHRAGLSPVRLTRQLSDDEADGLFAATRETLGEWRQRLRDEVGEGFPEKVTAFRPEMAVHGRHKQPCPRCGAPVQRIVYAENETNYCAPCQTGGRLLADRALSRLLRKDWPRSLDELEGHLSARRADG